MAEQNFYSPRCDSGLRFAYEDSNPLGRRLTCPTRHHSRPSDTPYTPHFSHLLHLPSPTDRSSSSQKWATCEKQANHKIRATTVRLNAGLPKKLTSINLISSKALSPVHNHPTTLCFVLRSSKVTCRLKTQIAHQLPTIAEHETQP